MNKSKIARIIAERLNCPIGTCELILDTFYEVIIESLMNDEKVVLRGLLTLETKEYGEREGYNPVTGNVEKFKPYKVVKCRVGKTIKDAVNER